MLTDSSLSPAPAAPAVPLKSLEQLKAELKHKLELNRIQNENQLVSEIKTLQEELESYKDDQEAASAVQENLDSLLEIQQLFSEIKSRESEVGRKKDAELDAMKKEFKVGLIKKKIRDPQQLPAEIAKRQEEIEKFNKEGNRPIVLARQQSLEYLQRLSDIGRQLQQSTGSLTTSTSNTSSSTATVSSSCCCR